VPTRRGAGGSRYSSAGPDSIAYVFVCHRSIIIRRWYRRSPVTLQQSQSVSQSVQLSVKFLTGQPLGGEHFFYKGPNPLSASRGGGKFFFD
jgi:hypothetical protein